jgi:fatty acid desaturase
MIVTSIPPIDPVTGSARLRVEWPTWGLVVAVYGGWAALTYWFTALPWVLALPAAAWLIAWQMSLQHEIIHGHPTKNARINTAIGFPPLSLWLPCQRYRQLHLAHHRNHLLTDPIEDPESYYATAEDWQRRGRLTRVMTRILNTSVGRILFNPAVAIPLFLIRDGKALLAGSGKLRRIWSVHALGVAAVLIWVLGVCGIPFWQYVVFFIYPGFALASVRSFAEHRSAAHPDHRTAIVENTPVFGLLFLHNNLHVVHHNHPHMPWYAIPAHYRANRPALLRQNDGLVYQGYGDVVRRYLLREHHAPVNPSMRISRPGHEPAVAGDDGLMALLQASAAERVARSRAASPDRLPLRPDRQMPHGHSRQERIMEECRQD